MSREILFRRFAIGLKRELRSFTNRASSHVSEFNGWDPLGAEDLQKAISFMDQIIEEIESYHGRR